MNSNIKNAIGTLLVVAALAGAGITAAQADINPSLPATPTITGSGVFTYTYPIEVSTTQTVNNGDFFTFYDINGYVAGSGSGAAGWTASESLTGPTATGASGSVSPVDDAGLTNLTFTYSGAPLVGQQGLGNFSFQSIYDTGTALESFTGRATLTGTSYKNANLTSYYGPTVSSVPEPASVATFALGGLGLLALIVRGRKTRLSSSLSA